MSSDTANLSAPSELVDVERQANRRFGCGVILLAPVVYFAVLLGAFSDQALFFTIGDYLEGPKAPSTMPWFVGLGLTTVTILGAVTSTLFPLIAAGFGLFLLLSGRYASIFVRLALILLPIPVLLLGTHTLVLLVFYVHSQGRMPAKSGEVLTTIGISYAIVLVSAAIMWLRVRRRWPRWASSSE